MEILHHSHHGRESKFKCPHCGVTSLYGIYDVQTAGSDIKFCSLVCRACDSESVWLVNDRNESATELNRIFPLTSDAPPPAQDMPDDVRKDYEEAALISIHSPKAACALLRLGFQKLCKHLGEPGEHLDTDIRSLAKKDGFPASIVKAADTLRITGNHAVHPGKMSDDDIAEVSNGLFGLLNYIVEQGITKPRELQKLYEMVPEGARKAAENKDRY